MSSRGPIIIDCNCATRGNPLADVARSSVLLLGGLASPLLRPHPSLNTAKGAVATIRNWLKQHGVMP
jgi:hypothetical protein